MNYTKFMEALRGKQHKIDKNKNGKVDAHDFKLLRKEETEELEEASVKSEKHSWGKMMTVHHGASHSYPLHPEHQEAIRNLKHGEQTSFKDETGAKVNVHRDVQDVHFTSNKTSTKTTVPHSHFSEEVKDEYARKVDTHLKNKYAPVAPVPDRKYIKGTPENKALKASRKPINGMPTNKMKEEVDQIEEDKMTTKKDKNGKLISFKYEGDWKKSTEKKQGSGKAANLAGQAMQKMAKANEAVSPISVKVNHALEAAHEEEWEDTGICPEHNKKDCHQCGKAGMKEQVEEIQEKSDQAKQNKTMKNVMAASKGAKLNRDSGLKLTPGDTGHSNAQQMNKALGRHAMRENEGQKSYKEFMMMLEYESDKSGSYTHKGSYGSEFAKKEREKDEKGFDSENEPAKRGPKMGSKRGPKANLGSSKLHTK
jgi:hypothetical protein